MVHGNYYSTLYAVITRLHRQEMEQGEFTAGIMRTAYILVINLSNQVNVFLQQKLVSSSGTNYAYKALMDVLLNYGIDAELSQLQTQLFYRDSGGSMDSTNPTTTHLNQGLIKRNLLAKNSATIDMVGPIYADVSRCQDTY